MRASARWSCAWPPRNWAASWLPCPTRPPCTWPRRPCCWGRQRNSSLIGCRAWPRARWPRWRGWKPWTGPVPRKPWPRRVKRPRSCAFRPACCGGRPPSCRTAAQLPGLWCGHMRQTVRSAGWWPNWTAASRAACCPPATPHAPGLRCTSTAPLLKCWMPWSIRPLSNSACAAVPLCSRPSRRWAGLTRHSRWRRPTPASAWPSAVRLVPTRASSTSWLISTPPTSWPACMRGTGPGRWRVTPVRLTPRWPKPPRRHWSAARAPTPALPKRRCTCTAAWATPGRPTAICTCAARANWPCGWAAICSGRPPWPIRWWRGRTRHQPMRQRASLRFSRAPRSMAGWRIRITGRDGNPSRKTPRSPWTSKTRPRRLPSALNAAPGCRSTRR